ncbi:hypothetical protein BC830DRAFT_1141818 [Chytriomyces sp. MP71]|nr:hypothetical protein BC830DRAFT_1141818 [Chytriomyces sp. MP71]
MSQNGGGESMGSFVQSLLLWAFLPRVATNWIMQYFVTPTFFKGLHPNDPRHRRNWCLTFTAVVVGYLAYTVVQVERDLPANFYALFGLTPSTFNTKVLKANYRSLSLAFHPDKNPGFHEKYILIRKAYDVLKDPLLKSAYDKFGMSVVEQCSGCKTERDFLVKGLYSAVYFYLGTAGFMTLYNLLGSGGFGAYWRYWSLFAIFTFEMNLLVSASDSLAWIVAPWRTTADRIAILHQLFVVASIAVGQLGPVWFPSEQQVYEARLAELEQLSMMNFSEAQGAFARLFAPFRNDSMLAGRLQRRMERSLVDSQILERNPDLTRKRE